MKRVVVIIATLIVIAVCVSAWVWIPIVLAGVLLGHWANRPRPRRRSSSPAEHYGLD